MKWLGVTLLLLLVISPATLSQVPDDSLIVPGIRLGKWTLEMSIDDLVRAFGPVQGAFGPTLGVPLPRGGPLFQDGLTLLTWTNSPISVLHRDRKKIEEIATGSEVFRTEKGVGVGSVGRAVLEAYGQPSARAASNQGIVIYDEIGIGFNICPNVSCPSAGDRVAAVFVFRSKTAATIWKF